MVGNTHTHTHSHTHTHLRKTNLTVAMWLMVTLFGFQFLDVHLIIL